MDDERSADIQHRFDSLIQSFDDAPIEQLTNDQLGALLAAADELTWLIEQLLGSRADENLTDPVKR